MREKERGKRKPLTSVNCLFVQKGRKRGREREKEVLAVFS